MPTIDDEPDERTRPTGFARRVLLGLFQCAAALWFCFWMLMAFMSFAFREFGPEPGSRLSVPRALLHSSIMVVIGCVGPLVSHTIKRGVNERDRPLEEKARGFEVLPSQRARTASCGSGATNPAK